MCYMERSERSGGLDSAVESFTANLWDEQFAPVYHYCKQCDDLVHEDRVVTTKCENGVYFCRERCRMLWEDANGWEYE